MMTLLNMVLGGWFLRAAVAAVRDGELGWAVAMAAVGAFNLVVGILSYAEMVAA